MTFQEKSTWIMSVLVLLVYGWYFAVVFNELPRDVGEVAYRPLMLMTVVVLVVVAAASHVLIALLNPADADRSDERDKEINRYGEYIGGFVIGVAALGALAMAMFELEHFWIANAILGGLVLSELTAGAVKIWLYRRGV